MPARLLRDSGQGIPWMPRPGCWVDYLRAIAHSLILDAPSSK
jgi:hypothetical protein